MGDGSRLPIVVLRENVAGGPRWSFTIDGVEIHGVRGVTVITDMGSTPEVHVNMIARSVDVETEAGELNFGLVDLALAAKKMAEERQKCVRRAIVEDGRKAFRSQFEAAYFGAPAKETPSE
jgi:hypothetical protein